MSAAALQAKKVRGLCLLDPAGRFGVLNPTGFNIPFLGIVADQLGQKMFDQYKTPAALKQTLQAQYADPSKVDGKLVDALAAPWQEPKGKARGPEIFSNLYNSSPDKKWEELISKEQVGYCGPLLVVWGDKDTVADPSDADFLKVPQPQPSLLSPHFSALFSALQPVSVSTAPSAFSRPP